MKAILRESEESGMVSQCPFVDGLEIEIQHGVLYDFIYDNEDNFYLIFDGRLYPEESTAFNFV